MVAEAMGTMRAAAAFAVLLLAGCGSAERLMGGGHEPEPLPAAPSGQVATTPLSPGARTGTLSPPPVEMAGRWMLASRSGGGCTMTFGASPGSPEGSIAPEGGCPGNFFTSRRWAFDQGALVIRNHTGEQLAQLALSASGRFEGQAATGEPVSLAR